MLYLFKETLPLDIHTDGIYGTVKRVLDWVFHDDDGEMPEYDPSGRRDTPVCSQPRCWCGRGL